jgi:hypothetical protein
LKDSKDSPGKPLRDLLRKGGIPHAYQVGGKRSSWTIPKSRKSAYTLIERVIAIQIPVKQTGIPFVETPHSHLDMLEALINEKHFKSAGVIDDLVPNHSGQYCDRGIDIVDLPLPYREAILTRNHNIMYIGIATKSLKTRFLGQELRAKGHGTLFRSIGAMLGYLPTKGSLVGKVNCRNFKFSIDNSRQIIEWINKNLIVNWIAFEGDFEALETTLIAQYRPLLNIDKNPEALALLRHARAECVRIANLE